MLRSYRHFIFALVGLALCPGQGAQAQKEQAHANKPQTVAAPLLTPDSVEQREPAELYRPCEQGKDARNSDLCAQWKAADAAKEASHWAELSFWLGLVGTVGLLATLFYTRAAVKVAQEATKDADSALSIANRNADAASKMAKEARRTNEIARATQLAQLRPYVYIRDMRRERARVVLNIKNFGATPAIDLDIRSNWAVVAPDFRGPFPGGLKSGDTYIELAPTQHMELGISVAEVNEAASEMIANSKAMLILELKYTYRDLLGSTFSGHARQGAHGQRYQEGYFSALPLA